MRGEEVAAGESWAISDNYQVTHCHTGPSWTSLTFSNNSQLREWSNVLEREGCISLHSFLASLDFNGRLMRESHLGGTILVTRENSLIVGSGRFYRGHISSPVTVSGGRISNDGDWKHLSRTRPRREETTTGGRSGDTSWS